MILLRTKVIFIAIRCQSNCVNSIAILSVSSLVLQWVSILPSNIQLAGSEVDGGAKAPAINLMLMPDQACHPNETIRRSRNT